MGARERLRAHLRAERIASDARAMRAGSKAIRALIDSPFVRVVPMTAKEMRGAKRRFGLGGDRRSQAFLNVKWQEMRL